MHETLISMQSAANHGIHIDEDLIGLLAVVLGICACGLPAVVFSIARRWAKDSPDLSGTLIGGAVAVSIVSILSGAAVVLAILGWLPSPTEFL